MNGHPTDPEILVVLSCHMSLAAQRDGTRYAAAEKHTESEVELHECQRRLFHVRKLR